MIATERAGAAELLYREALYLDEQRWDEWLALYLEDAVFWMPAWIGAHELTSSPDTQLSLIYCDSRKRLEDRVWRIRSELSVASRPLPRTVHAVNNVLVVDERDDRLDVRASWSVHSYDPARTRPRCHPFDISTSCAAVDGARRIARKKIILADDRIATMLDFYFGLKRLLAQSDPCRCSRGGEDDERCVDARRDPSRPRRPRRGRSSAASRSAPRLSSVMLLPTQVSPRTTGIIARAKILRHGCS